MTETILVTAAVLLRVLSNPLGNVFQKQLTAKGNHPLLVNFLTYALLSTLCVIPALFFTGWRTLPNEFWTFSILGGITGAVGNGFLVKALEKGHLSVLGPINAYKSVVGIIGGILLLGELPTAWGLLGIALIIWGSYFVLDSKKEGFSRALLRKKEIQFRLWAMVLTAIEAVFIKKVILASSPTLAFYSWCWWGLVFSFLLLFLYRLRLRQVFSKTSPADAGQYSLLVACIGTMQLTTNYVLDHLPVGYALSLFQLSAVVSVLLGYRVFNETNIRRKLLGAVIMIAGSVVIILLKNR